MPKVETIVGAAIAVLFLAAGPALAGVGGSVVPTYPAGPVHVGHTFEAALVIDNDSDGANAAEHISVSNISHTPSCASGGNICPAAATDPNVFQVSPTAKGARGSACAGVTFNVTTVDPATGELQFAPNRPWTLGPGNKSGGSTECEINFTVKVLKMPARDSGPEQGVQTDSLAHATFSNDKANPQRGAGGGTSRTTVAQ